jgi:hypothetical protein
MTIGKGEKNPFPDEKLHHIRVLTLFSLENDMVWNQSSGYKTTALMIIHRIFEAKFSKYMTNFDQSDPDTYWLYILRLAKSGIHLINVKKKSGKHYLWMINSKFQEAELLALGEKKPQKQIALEEGERSRNTKDSKRKKRSRSRSRSRSSSRSRSRSRSYSRERNRKKRRRSRSSSRSRSRSKSHDHKRKKRSKKSSRKHSRKHSRSRKHKEGEPTITEPPKVIEGEPITSDLPGISNGEQKEGEKGEVEVKTDSVDVQRKLVRILHLEASIETTEKHLRELRERLMELLQSSK